MHCFSYYNLHPGLNAFESALLERYHAAIIESNATFSHFNIKRMEIVLFGQIRDDFEQGLHIANIDGFPIDKRMLVIEVYMV